MSKDKGSALGTIVWLLIIIGALNWGLVGFFQFNLVDVIFHAVPMVSRVVYAVVGLCALYSIYTKLKG